MAVSKMRRGYEIKMRGRGTNPEPMGLPDMSFQRSRHDFQSQTKARRGRELFLGPSFYI
jgi:hypothetical protein